MMFVSNAFVAAGRTELAADTCGRGAFNRRRLVAKIPARQGEQSNQQDREEPRCPLSSRLGRTVAVGPSGGTVIVACCTSDGGISATGRVGPRDSPPG